MVYMLIACTFRDIREQVPLEDQNRAEIYGAVGEETKTI